ncbi:hypothetical protein B5M09_009775 [Aphanomyces astaci]|uniref:DDE-1 domain-containing protein n=1 Tax=Aphanomyces astaci TaxID=112090 RepID=A0A425C3M5_APHAT|nr:hypothetical protein B5M09_009775 [Aphanomyces astaci]
MKPIKAKMRLKWAEFLTAQNTSNGSGGGKSFRLQCPERWDLVEWIHDAWDTLPTSTIVSGFVKCQIIDADTSPSDFDVPDALTHIENDGFLQTLVEAGEFEVLDPDDNITDGLDGSEDDDEDHVRPK